MFWKLCEVPSLSKSKENFIENTDAKYNSDMKYNSIYTYNTEKNFRNKYGAFEEDSPIELPIDLSFFDRLIEILFIIVSSLSIGIFFPFSLIFCLKFINTYERVVIMRLGRFKTVYGPGVILVLPLVDSSFRIDIRVTRLELPTLQVITYEHGVVEFSVSAFMTLKSLSYTTLYKRFVKKFTDDFTNPDKSALILEKCKDELNSFTMSFGIEMTSLSIHQLKVIKEGDNPALSALNAFVKSDVGCHLLGQIGTGLKAYMESNTSNSSVIPKQDPVIGFQNLVNNKSAEKLVQDQELLKLVDHINRLCSEKLVLLVKKRYQIRCILPSGDFLEIYLDLSVGSGSCSVVSSVIYNPDVIISLRKDTLLSLLYNEISPMSAYIDGLIQIDGSVADAVKLKLVADAIKLDIDCSFTNK